MRLLGKALTFDDVLLVPAFSQVLPRDTSLATRLSRNIALNLPLISAAMVRERPIETILSGPAASIVGARWLTGAADALVSDIGGTTTDVAHATAAPVMPHSGISTRHRPMVMRLSLRAAGCRSPATGRLPIPTGAAAIW